MTDLDPEAPGLDEETRKRRRALRELMALPDEEYIAFLIEVGILTPDRKLTEPYLDDSPSLYRPNGW